MFVTGVIPKLRMNTLASKTRRALLISIVLCICPSPLRAEPHLSAPVAVCYAWATNPDCNLYNKEGIPASPFRTDDWPGVTANEKWR
jgi:hypothetical protein